MSKVGTTDITGIMLGDTEIVKAYLGSDIVYQKSKPSYEDQYLTFVAEESGTFTFTPQSDNVINYSTNNGKTWTQGNSVAVNSGDKVMWKGTMTPASSQGVGKFGSTGNFDVQGNIMSLLYGDNYKGQTDLTGKDYAFYQLFYNNTKIINTENLSLPATTLASDCYRGMFGGCTNLITAPVLPATTLANNCYYEMFNGCTALTSASELPATTLTDYCYRGMFYSCTSLVNAPELPATTLAVGCYQNMLSGCTSLTTAPVLPATTLVSSCYQNMFKSCTSLTTAPVLSATTLSNYCYNNMFNGCTSLNYIKAMFTTTPSTTYTYNWVRNVAASGTFVKNAAASWTTTGVNGIPTGWTVETADS
jgi:hypothetical protein